MRWLAAVALAAALVTGCGEDDDTVTVSAAASLKTAFEVYGEQFGDVRFSFAGSDELAAQIEQGVKPDVYAAANRTLPDDLFEQGLVEEPVVFAGNRLVLAVPAGAGEVGSLADAAGSGVNLAIGSESVPVGAYTRKVLDALPPRERERILANVRSEEPDVAGIVGKLHAGRGRRRLRLRLRRAWRRRRAGGDRAARRAAADGRVRRRGRRGRAEPRGGTALRGRAAVRRRGAGAPRRGLRAAAVTFRITLTAALALALCFLTLPIVAIFVDAGPLDLVESLGEPGALEALRLSLVCTTVAVAIIVLVGTPAAYLLATRRFRGRATVVTLIELPLVLPPAVAGIGLLAALGPNGLLGGLVEDAGLQLVLTTAGVIVALTFVAAPFYLRQAQTAFEAVDRTWLDASRTLGASEARTFARIAIPGAGSGLASGLALAWGRALGEFGATLMFAGSFRGITQTVPLAIYERFSTDFTGALALSAVLVAVSAALLLSVKLLSGAEWFGGAAR